MSLHSCITVIPVSKLERKRQMDLNITIVEFLNIKKMTCKTSKFNAIVLKIHSDSTINSNKMSAVLFEGVL